MLGYMAEPLHPHRPPRFDYYKHRWMWVPPWFEGDPGGHERDGEILGANIDHAEAALVALRMKVLCAHGKRIGVPCPDCRKGVLEAIGDLSAS